VKNLGDPQMENPASLSTRSSRISEQTNMLALNAAIEAGRAPASTCLVWLRGRLRGKFSA